MKVIVNVAAIATCLTVFVVGHQHWKEKIEVHAAQSKTSVVMKQPVTAEEEAVDVMRYTKNLPPFFVKKIEQAIQANKPLSFVIAGPHATTEEGSWAVMVKQFIEETYGKEVFTVHIHSLTGETSANILAKSALSTLEQYEPDVVLYEPPTLLDNGLIGIHNTVKNTNEMMQQLKQLPSAPALLVQPSQPLAQASVYPNEVTLVKEVIDQHGVYYVDHWKTWPEGEALSAYVSVEGVLSEKGHAQWASFYKAFFKGV
ncbi:SGNH/GDSL hydrolase family protein [Metabacillus iocasae]|uniref:SGNH/GDSL hydrolase family protein n=1 Tax=Priestia iocasae TaxID=2291674 RepID=A0ABS2QS28_9BACI|nr:SGNH/GDSL hydrolase family protein [Metabacillus iocasae]MBM7702261.1 hypothetical protein [Metabacillus iocasae]